MIIAAELDGVVRAIVNEVVRHAVSHAVDADCRTIGSMNPAELVEVIIIRVMAGGGQGFAFPTAERHAPFACLVNVTADHAILAAAGDGDTPTARISHHATGEAILRAACHHHRRAARRFQSHPLESKPRGFSQREKSGQHRENGFSLGQIIGRPEINEASCPVQIPFAGRIQFGQQVERVKALARPITIAVIRLVQLDDVGLVDRLHFLERIGPIPEPITVQPNLRFLAPAAGLIARVRELADLIALDAVAGKRLAATHVRNLHKTAVRPARQGHRLLLKKQLRPLAGSGHVTEIRHARGFQVRLPNLVSRWLREPGEHGRFVHQSKITQHLALRTKQLFHPGKGGKRRARHRNPNRPAPR